MKAKYILGLAATAFLFGACSDDQLDKINKDEAHPNSTLVSGELAITDAEVGSIYNSLCQSYAWYTASYTEQECGTGNNQLKNIELRLKSEMASSSTFSNEWNQTYSTLFNLKDIKNKCQEGGVNSGNYALLGMAQTVEALDWGILTDMHGNIPCSEALTDGISAPKLDSQEEVYNKIFTLLDSAIVNFSQASSVSNTLLTHDVFFKGDLTQWTGLAHALKARFKLHTMGRDNSALQEALTEAQTAVNGGFTGAELDIFDGTSQYNSWVAYVYSRDYTASSKTEDDLLLERNDPRESLYNYKFYKNSQGVETPGNREQAQSTETMALPKWYNYKSTAAGAAPLHIFSSSELYFIIAECQARLGQDAKEAFNNGVSASFEDLYSASGETLGSNTVSDYLASIDSFYTASPLREILIQKYIAQSRDEQVETYNDIRRVQYVDGSYPVTLTNPNNTQNGGRNYWPNMLPYGESDVTNNPNVAAAFGTGSDAGEYLFNNKVWWAGGE